MDREGLQRDDGQGIFHLTAADGVAAPHHNLVDGIVLQAQAASANNVYIVGVVGIEVAIHMGAIVDVDVEVHIEARERRTVDDILGRVLQINKLHKALQLVVGGEGRVFQVVSQVGCAQHVQSAAHRQVADRSLHQTIEIYKRLAVSL